jgi:hypothetical protein
MTTALANTTTLATLPAITIAADANGRYPNGQTDTFTVTDAENRTITITCLDFIKSALANQDAILNYHFQAEVKTESAGWDDDRFYLAAYLDLVVWCYNEKSREASPHRITLCRVSAANGKYENCGGEFEAGKFLQALPTVDCPLTSAWKSLMAEFPVVPMADREGMRTNCILRLVERCRNEIVQDANRNIRKGDEVEVVKGRKVPVGAKGKVVGFFNGSYGKRVGIDIGGTEVDEKGRPVAAWTSIDNVEVIVPDLDAKAVEMAKERYTKVLVPLFGPARA